MGTVVRSTAGTALGQIGPAAEEAVPALIAAFKDKDHGLATYYALAKIGPAAVPALTPPSRTRTRGCGSAPPASWARSAPPPRKPYPHSKLRPRDGELGAESALEKIRGER
ncbi:MAG: HEAT repeat domain-containing protein [Planctomycetota bacterium]|jgi:hypothetical protein